MSSTKIFVFAIWLFDHEARSIEEAFLLFFTYLRNLQKKGSHTKMNRDEKGDRQRAL